MNSKIIATDWWAGIEINKVQSLHVIIYNQTYEIETKGIFSVTDADDDWLVYPDPKLKAL